MPKWTWQVKGRRKASDKLDDGEQPKPNAYARRLAKRANQRVQEKFGPQAEGMSAADLRPRIRLQKHERNDIKKMVANDLAIMARNLRIDDGKCAYCERGVCDFVKPKRCPGCDGDAVVYSYATADQWADLVCYREGCECARRAYRWHPPVVGSLRKKDALQLIRSQTMKAEPSTRTKLRREQRKRQKERAESALAEPIPERRRMPDTRAAAVDDDPPDSYVVELRPTTWRAFRDKLRLMTADQEEMRALDDVLVAARDSLDEEDLAWIMSSGQRAFNWWRMMLNTVVANYRDGVRWERERQELNDRLVDALAGRGAEPDPMAEASLKSRLERAENDRDKLIIELDTTQLALDVANDANEHLVDQINDLEDRLFDRDEEIDLLHGEARELRDEADQGYRLARIRLYELQRLYGRLGDLQREYDELDAYRLFMEIPRPAMSIWRGESITIDPADTPRNRWLKSLEDDAEFYKSAAKAIVAIEDNQWNVFEYRHREKLKSSEWVSNYRMAVKTQKRPGWLERRKMQQIISGVHPELYWALLDKRMVLGATVDVRKQLFSTAHGWMTQQGWLNPESGFDTETICNIKHLTVTAAMLRSKLDEVVAQVYKGSANHSGIHKNEMNALGDYGRSGFFASLFPFGTIGRRKLPDRA